MLVPRNYTTILALKLYRNSTFALSNPLDLHYEISRTGLLITDASVHAPATTPYASVLVALPRSPGTPVSGPSFGSSRRGALCHMALLL